MSKTLQRITLYITLSIVLLWMTGYAAFILHISTVKPDSNIKNTDAIVVLTGGSNRINTGLNLLSAHAAPELFISGVNKNVSVEKLLAMWPAGEKQKKQPCCITLGHKAQNTTQNAQEAREWTGQKDVTSLRLVTSHYHMPRARLEFRNTMPSMNILIHPVIPDDLEIEDKGFWHISFEEYNKTLLTWVRLQL